jgi:hypothetical protein
LTACSKGLNKMFFLKWIPGLRENRRARIKIKILIIQFAFVIICFLILIIAIKLWFGILCTCSANNIYQNAKKSKFSCPFCGKDHKFDLTYIGNFKCKKCGNFSQLSTSARILYVIILTFWYMMFTIHAPLVTKFASHLHGNSAVLAFYYIFIFISYAVTYHLITWLSFVFLIYFLSNGNIFIKPYPQNKNQQRLASDAIETRAKIIVFCIFSLLFLIILIVLDIIF